MSVPQRKDHDSAFPILNATTDTLGNDAGRYRSLWFRFANTLVPNVRSINRFPRANAPNGKHGRYRTDAYFDLLCSEIPLFSSVLATSIGETIKCLPAASIESSE